MLRRLKRRLQKILGFTGAPESPTSVATASLAGSLQASPKDGANYNQVDSTEEASRNLETPAALDPPSTSDSDSDYRMSLRRARAIKVWEDRRFTVEHDGHQDKILTRNEWTFHESYESQVDFYNEWVLMRGDSLSNDQLYEKMEVQEYLKALTSLSRHNLPTLAAFYDPPRHNKLIPLFQGENGNEYQLELSYSTDISQLYCPSAKDCDWRFGPVQIIPSKVSTETCSRTNSIPKILLPIGDLWIRGHLRPCEDSDDTEDTDDTDEQLPESERTDWAVMVDVEDEKLPLWIFVSRQKLADRRENANWSAEPPLAILDGQYKELEVFGIPFYFFSPEGA
ncbi:hypothetical protein B0I35DRAFT_499797 [Stachybotrys elegans]|uniref:Uncharacterized protein n=1 Tax=Stachybotrys elegans TaxID=80388 RepID=A0A8K0WT57_9HYPO|nr:hypothetical protein B0I35DRAFT_499797 [Stachybotrys elegans]